MAYKILREELYLMEQSGMVIAELEPPLGSLNLIEQKVQELRDLGIAIPEENGDIIEELGMDLRGDN
jgi:hypothetical protein